MPEWFSCDGIGIDVDRESSVTYDDIELEHVMWDIIEKGTTD